MKNWIYLFFFLIFFAIFSDASDNCNDDGWSPYSDEKCIKVFEFATSNYDEAEAFCANQAQKGEDEEGGVKSKREKPVTRLLSISTAAEQAFLEDFLFKQKVINDDNNVWLGGRYDTEKNVFRWKGYQARENDNGEDNFLTEGKAYTNWRADHPKKQEADYCIEMITGKEEEGQGEENKGKWIEQPCVKAKNRIVCERMQVWSLTKMAKLLTRMEKRLEAKLKEEVSRPKVPIDFIYVQLPQDKSPEELWPWHNWTIISQSYDSNFFRIEGTKAVEFGKGEQDEYSPYIDEVQFEYSVYNDNDYITLAKVPREGGWSSKVYNTPFYACIQLQECYRYQAYHKFHFAEGEVRPRNVAVRLWKRTG